jgi:hypothetical protein
MYSQGSCLVMTSKEQERLIRDLKARLPKGADAHFDADAVNSYLLSIVKIEYINREGVEKVLPLTQEEKDFFMEESDVPKFYIRTFACGGRLLLMRDSKSKELPREIELPYPCKMLRANEYYTLSYLNKPSKEENYTFIWDT